MKVILLRDVAKIGHRFDIVEVPDGYAMNKLVPQKAAMPATPGNIKKIRAHKEQQAAGAASNATHFGAVVAALDGKTATLSLSANEDGGLFESLKPVRIAEAFSEVAGLKVLEEYVVLTEPIKHTGDHVVRLAHGDSSTNATISVSAA